MGALSGRHATVVSPGLPQGGVFVVSEESPRPFDLNSVQDFLTTLLDVKPPFIPEGASAMVLHVKWPPGHPGLPPHRHSGPAFGYVIEGAIRFEVEGEPERVVRTGETFWEPGGDVIHYQDGNARSGAPTEFVVTMLCEPGQPMLTLVDEEELKMRAHLRAPRPAAA